MRHIRFVVVFLGIIVVLSTLQSVEATHHRGVDAVATVDAGGVVRVVGFEASGPADDLTGQGFSAPGEMGTSSEPGNPAVFHFRLTGAATDTVVNLSGVVTASSDPELIGSVVVIDADASTGSVVLVVGGITFFGTGSVSIHDARD